MGFKSLSFCKLTFFAFSLLLGACAERPIYEPAPAPQTTVSGSQQKPAAGKSTGTPADAASQTADATNNMMTGNDQQTPPAATPPATTPAPAAPPAAPAEPVGVAATGRTLIMQNCIATGCHGSTPLNAKDDAGLQAGMNIVAHSAALKAGNYFTKPAAGTAANNYSHVLAYLKANPNTPIMGPNIP
jgi:hypothetical protein